ncbi:HN1_G0054390.mRNA.1.CDS.1 [Saccharomyces cerevisiae]|nr:HN1_G0054390.mRNA.1.CDS.1 [Saccharomyces cerevisiae]CAI4487179.1 BAL_1a_G0022570.mRNA.1.CDS.1 [Saccharomyces cerevisiae]CAI7139841.1 BAL_1a_G0022570.mRNA.1.CDS.1 [Saccharomyces cerevisiae]
MFEVSSILEKLPQNILLFHYPLPSKMENNLLMSFLTQRSIDENEIDALLHPNAVYRSCNLRTTFRTLSSYGK